MNIRKSIYSVVGFCGVSVAACGGSSSEAPPPSAAPPMALAASPATIAPPPPPPVAPPPPQAGPCDGSQTLALTTMVQARQQTEAAGMVPQGTTVCSVLPEGQAALSAVFMLEQGQCYTFLAQALPSVAEVDMQLELDLTGGAAVPPALAAFNIKPVLAIDTDAGPQGSIGGKKNCYQWPFPIPATAKLVVRSRAGAGPVFAQGFKKKK